MGKGTKRFHSEFDRLQKQVVAAQRIAETSVAAARRRRFHGPSGPTIHTPAHVSEYFSHLEATPKAA